MAAVGGVFHQRVDAQQAADALVLAGMSPRSLRYDVLPRSLVDVLGPLGIPREAVPIYEPQISPGDILLTVTTDALPVQAIENEIAQAGGLVVGIGRTPSAGREIR